MALLVQEILQPQLASVLNLGTCRRLLAGKERRKGEKKDSPFLSFFLSFLSLFSPTFLPHEEPARRLLSASGSRQNFPSNEVRERQVSTHFCPLIFAAIATSNVEDIRSVLDFYRREDDIIEAFKRNQARLREAEEARSPQQAARSSWTGMFGRGFSFGRSSNKSVSWKNFVLVCC